MSHKYLYLGNYDQTNTELFNAARLFTYLEQYLRRSFDIIRIDELENRSIDHYELIIIDTLLFVPSFGVIDQLPAKLDPIKQIKHKVLLFHDLHDYSLGAIANVDVNSCLDVMLNDRHKSQLVEFFKRYEITHSISIYDCLEYDYLGHYFKHNYLLNHSYDPNIFTYRNQHKIYDVLIYGSLNTTVYPLRQRLLTLCQDLGLRIKVCPTDYYYRSTGPCEQRLSDLINQSWLCISSVSIFGYLVRKYLEIPAAGSVILGNLNDQGRSIIGHNLVEISTHYSDELIKSIISYYLNHKALLTHLSKQGLDRVRPHTYQHKATQLEQICQSVCDGVVCPYQYQTVVNQLKQIDRNTYDYQLVNGVVPSANNTISIKTVGDYCLESTGEITLQTVGQLTAIDQGITYRAFSITQAPCELVLSGHGTVHLYQIIKCPRFTTNLYPQNHQINQIQIAQFLKNGFEGPIMERFNHLRPKTSQGACLYYGLRYQDELINIQNNHGLSVIIWTGGDIDINNPTESKNVLSTINIISKLKGVRLIATSKFIQKDLEQLKLPYLFVPFMGINLDMYQPVPKGDSIYIYTSHDIVLYGKDLYDQVIARYPQIKFLLYTHPAQYNLAVKNGQAKYYQQHQIKCLSDPQEIIRVYQQCFLGLRLTKHDGLSATVQELGCLGIKTIHNGNSPSAINYQTIDDICQIIDTEMKTIGTVDQELSRRVKQFLTIDDNFFQENNHYNNINYVFDHIYVLNLDRSTDRRANMLHHLTANNITNYHFYQAVDGYTEPYLSQWKTYSQTPLVGHETVLRRKLIGSAGVLGNLLSIRNILLDAQQKHYRSIFILEDDVKFHQNFNSLFSQYMRLVPDNWLCLLLGAGVNQIDRGAQPINQHIYPCGQNLSGGFAMGLNHIIFDQLIEQCNQCNAPFDSGPLHHVINQYARQCFIYQPNLIISDVETSTMRSEKRNIKTFATQVGWQLEDYVLTIT